MVLGSATLIPNNEDTNYTMKICINIYNSFNNENAAGVTAYKAFGCAMNCWGIITITGDEAIYLMGYHECGSTVTANNIKLQAIKLY